VTAGNARSLVAEVLGTGLLVATVVGSGIMAMRLTGDAALALLCSAAVTGAMLAVLVTLFAPVSGAHFNPAVTLAFALRGALPVAAAAAYAGAQAAGGIAGAILAHAMFELPLVQAGGTVRTGAGQWLAEGVASFGLVLTVLGGAAVARPVLPALVGLYIAAAHWFAASTAFANPAAALARALTDSAAGIRPADLPGFVAAQVAGAVLAVALARWLFPAPVAPLPRAGA
jgi:glycerol uptake facilitator-like aquaporin